MAEQPNGGILDRIIATFRDFSAVLIPLAAFGVFLYLMSRFFPKTKLGHGDNASLLSRAGSALARAFTTNWQLTRLATTAFVLSLASGWTTWDGMKNFTGEPILS